MNVEIGYDEAMMPTMLCDPAKSTATKIGNLNGNRGLHMYVYIYTYAQCTQQKCTLFVSNCDGILKICEALWKRA